MALYSGNNDLAGTKQAITTSYKTLLAYTAATATLRRFKVYDVMVGTLGTPADQSYDFDISRQTAAGTATSITLLALDPADAASDTVAVANATAEGTITATSSVFYIGMNQRASYRWVASPGSELVAPATNLAGFALRARSASGGTAVCSAAMMIIE
jgi:hypothetical protein